MGTQLKEVKLQAARLHLLQKPKKKILKLKKSIQKLKVVRA
jgi:hypothetical protein